MPRLQRVAPTLCSHPDTNSGRQMVEGQTMKIHVGNKDPVRAGVLLILLTLAVCTCAGIVYWAWHGSLIGVTLSALVPALSGIWFLRA